MKKRLQAKILSRLDRIAVALEVIAEGLLVPQAGGGCAPRFVAPWYTTDKDGAVQKVEIREVADPSRPPQEPGSKDRTIHGEATFVQWLPKGTLPEPGLYWCAMGTGLPTRLCRISARPDGSVNLSTVLGESQPIDATFVLSPDRVRFAPMLFPSPPEE